MKCFYAGLLSLSFVVSGAPQSHAGLLSYYSFDSGFTDASGNTNDLSIAGGTPSITTSAGDHIFGGGALDLSGSGEYLTLSNGYNFGSTDPWSVSFWARRRPGAGISTGMVMGDQATTASFIWNTANSGQVDGLRFRPTSGGVGSGNNDFATGTDTSFHHWVLIADGTGKITVYLDNINLGTSTASGGTPFVINSIGQGYSNGSFSFNGQIDEVHIYDEAINATTVSQLFIGDAGPDETPPTLVGSDISDNRAGGPVAAHSLVTYTLTFSEDIDDSTVDAGDFGNAGTAAITIGSIVETSPGVFSIEVTPISEGTLQLQILADATLADFSGNSLDTISAITAEGIITVEVGFNPSAVQRVRVFLLGGQSNADGRADPSGLPTSPVNLQQPQDDVDFYEGSLMTLRPVGSQFGPEVTLGRCLADSIGDGSKTRVAVLKYASGGTNLHTQWKGGGDAMTNGDGPLYVTFQSRITAGMAALTAAYPNATIEIEGMLWVQGESDAGASSAADYESNLTTFIDDIRLTFGSELLFIVSRLSSDQTAVNASGLATIRAAQDAVALSDPMTGLVDTDGFGMKGDRLHFDAVGQQQIGKAAATELLKSYPFTSKLEFSLIVNGDVQFSVSNAFPGFRYTLQTNKSLQEGDWLDAETVVAEDQFVALSYSPTIGDDVRFFRVSRTAGP